MQFSFFEIYFQFVYENPDSGILIRRHFDTIGFYHLKKTFRDKFCS